MACCTESGGRGKGDPSEEEKKPKKKRNKMSRICRIKEKGTKDSPEKKRCNN
jgi:hypothetical protein